MVPSMKTSLTNKTASFSCIPMFFVNLVIFLNLCLIIQTSSSSSSSNSESESMEVSGNAMRPSLASQVPLLVGEETSAENRIKYNNHNHHHQNHRNSVPDRSQGTENNEIVRGNPRNNNINHHITNNNNNNNFHTESPSQSQPVCLNCASAQQNQQFESTLPEGTLRAMRLEMIKRQILKKLRVTEPPRVEDMPKDQKLLPTPVVLGDTLSGKKSRNRDRDVEDFYGKTEQVIVFPEEVMPGCLTFTNRNDPSACFLFNLPRKIQPHDISSAVLWVYKLPSSGSRRNQSFWLSEIHRTNTDPSEGFKDDGSSYSEEEYSYGTLPLVARSKIIGTKLNFRQRQGWMSLNISSSASHWLRRSDTDQSVTNVTLQIGCKDCGFLVGDSPVDTFGERPFIVFHIAGVMSKRRTRRHVDCIPGLSECCRERFVVDFREIGLDHWIIAPQSYDAYYCKGSCISINSLSNSKTGRTTIVQKYLQYHGVTNRTQELVPCCTASKMSSIRLFFRDLDALNTTIRDETLPNMVIESCGCL